MLEYQSIKLKSFSILQERRRKEVIENSRRRRDALIAKRREQLFLDDLKTSVGLRFDEAAKKDEKRRAQAMKDQMKRRQFSQTLCMPEWMTEVPSDLKSNWICVPKPDGKRYILSSKNGRSTLRTIYGYSQSVKTNLPGGVGSYRGNSVLDVILTGSCVYVMDILYFNNVDYGESEAESRLFTLHSRLSETEYWLHVNGKQYGITTPPFFDCTESSLRRVYESSFPFQLNGLLFLQKTGRVDAGCSPLQLLWKDAHTAQYFVNTDRDGVVLQRQEVTLLYAQGCLVSLEGVAVGEGVLEGVLEAALVRCAIEGVTRGEGGEWRIERIEPLGLASMAKTLPDSLSKIVFQEMARVEPLSFEQILGVVREVNV
ncbi:hypothetical protein WA556_004264 [Blastocystis sp. ATCC 50177/Nand II]